jgi:arylsulfatase A-like enzyme
MNTKTFPRIQQGFNDILRPLRAIQSGIRTSAPLLLVAGLLALVLLPTKSPAHPLESHEPMGREALRSEVAESFLAKYGSVDEFLNRRMALAKKPLPSHPQREWQVASGPGLDLTTMLVAATIPPAGYGETLARSFDLMKPHVRYYWDSSYFYVESDNMPDRNLMPNLMVGITAWQQQVPMPASYFFSTVNPENNPGSLGYQQRNVWKIPLNPVPAASPISLNGNFLRGAVAIAANGIAIFNPRNNRGEFSYDIGELDTYGGHCGLADDYHYHIAPVHLQGVLGVDKPVAVALDGYPIYGFTEPDGSAMLPLDIDGGHDHGPWGYHYHARGNATTGVHTAPFLMDAMHGAVVNFGGQIDPQPTVQNMRPSPSGGYEAKAVAGAAITAFMNPVAFTVDGGGHFVHDPNGVPSNDQYLMRYTIGSSVYDVCWRLNRNANPKSYTMTFRHPDTGTTTTTYANTGATNRIKAYGMAAASLRHLPDTGATQDGTTTFGEDNDYTRYAPSFIDNGDGTITDQVTGLMWQKIDNGESTWDTAVANAASVTTGGYSDWRLPTPREAFSILNHANNPAVNPTYFPNHPSGAAGYWWTSDIFGTDATRVWCTNSGGGLGAHPKTETLSAGGSLRFHARYVRGKAPTNGHNYVNNGDGTITDTDTELMWTQVPSAAMNWTSAISHAENLTTAGYTDWRLPNIKELQTLVDITLATSTSAATALSSIQRTLFPSVTATAYWSSTPLRSGGGSPTQAWLAEFGVNTAATPPRNSQGILSYEPFASTYPVLAVRNAPSRSVSQGLGTPTITNLFPAGQRVSAVGAVTATDGTIWTVPSATQFTTAAKAPDLYNDASGVTPANIAAAQAAIDNAPTVVIDNDGEVVTGYLFADNYFELYVNGTLVAVDPVPYTPFNSCFVKFKAKRPITYAIKLVDWEENLGVGSELNGPDPFHPGDGGLFASFSDGTVTNSEWKAQSFYIAPLNDPELVVEQADGTHDSSATGLQAPTLNGNSYALHYAVPTDWFSKTFDDAGWPDASTYTETEVGVTGKPAFTNFPDQFSNSGGSFIWSSNLVLDNEVIVRYTGPAAQPKITIEQPAGIPLIDGQSTVNYGTVNTGSTLSKTFTITNTDTVAMTISGVTIDGTDASSFSVTTPPAASLPAGGSTTMVVQFAPGSAGSKTAQLHLASSDVVASPAFDISLAGTGNVLPPSITDITVNPISPTSTDSVTITARVTPGSGATINGVTLAYDLGAQVTADVFRETFAMQSSNNWNGTTQAALNAWSTVGAGNVRQANLASNRTVPVTLSNCATTAGSATVTCQNTASLWPNMFITGPNLPSGAKISSIQNGTTFVMSGNATATGSALTLTASGMAVLNCTTTTGSATVTCASTVGLQTGMGLSGTGLANSATVSSITDGTTFVMSANATTGASGITITASGNALEFQAGTATLTDTMATTTNAINAAGTSGFVEFYVQTRDLTATNNHGWEFQVSPDGGTTWNTRLSERWNAHTVNLSGVVTNAAGAGGGSTTVTCSDTSGLSTGRSVSASPVYVTGGTTSGSAVVTCTNTTGLMVGMFVSSNGNTIPNNTRITAINPNVDFTISANATATNAAAPVAANLFPANATVQSITNATTFVLNTAAYANTSASPVAATATTINHGYTTKADGTAQPYRYDLAGAELGSNTKFRFQYAGAAATQPTRSGRVSIDDIRVNTTAGTPPATITMTDLGGGLWSATIPPQADGSSVNFSLSATGSAGGGTTSTVTSYTVAPSPTITTTSPLPNGSTTGAYSQTFASTGGSGTGYVWSLFSGSLPNGVTLSSGGVLSGTPTHAGNFNFTVQVTDSATRSATKAFALTITTVTAPNVLIILTDDQGWGDIGYHTPAGQVPIQTPHMDGLLSSGIRLENFYATTVCSVTRATLMTGRNQIRTGVNNTRGLALREHIMPQSFKAAGYQTYMCGKWHIGGSDKNLGYTTVNGQNVRVIQEGLEYAPHNRGWDLHYGQYSGAIHYSTHHSNEELNPDLPDWWLNGVQQDGPSEHTDSQGHGGYSTDLLADKAVSCIQNRDPSKPMLLWLAFNAIHGPVSVPEEYLDKYTAIADTKRRTIAAAVDCMDAAIGRVLDQLTASGIADNTIVVFMSDNGGQESGGSLNDPLRGTKGDSWDGGVHLPAAISWPGVLATNVVSKQYVWVGDIFPTLCAATGVTAQNTEPFDGLNLWPALLSINSGNPDGQARPLDKPLVTISATPIALNRFTDPVNGGEKVFKLIRNKVGQSVVNELYNMTDDVDPATGAPIESTDLLLGPNVSAYSGIVTSLTTAITDIAPINYPPYTGPPLITNTVAQGSTIELYAPFTSYPNGTITAQWRKNGVNISGGTGHTEVTDLENAVVRGAYTTKLTLTNVQPSDAAAYDVVITNTAGSTTSASGVLTVTMPAPDLTLPAFTKGTSITLNWTAVPGATGYTIQRSTTADFASVTSLSTANTSVTFTGLTSGIQYYYRGSATDGTNTSAFGSAASSTQDAGAPVVTITAPADNTVTTSDSITVTGTATDAVSPLTGLMVNGVPASTTDNYATWTATVTLAPGSNTITATANDSADQGGNSGTAGITVTYNASGPAIDSLSTTPTAPTYLDPAYITARVTPRPGTSLTNVQLQYDTSTPVSTPIWRETFNNTSTNNWNGTGSINPWSTIGGGAVRQAIAQSNRTAPVSVTAAVTTNGSTTVTCTSTAGLWPGMLVTGPNIPGSINGTATGNTTVASVTNATTFVLSQAAIGTGSGLTLTAAGVTLTNATTTTGSTAVTCDSTAGLSNGMSLSGTGLANNATVASVTGATTFTMNAVPTTAGSGLTLVASGAAAEFNGGTATPTDSMFTTTNPINTSGSAGYIEFYVQTRDLAANNNCGWTMQVSSDNGATWNTRLVEDWNSKTVNLTDVVINGSGAANGSTTVTCADTTGLTTGRSIAGPIVYVTCGLTSGQSTVTCANTTGLLAGMSVTGTGIPNNTRIGAITPDTSFTLVTGTAATPVNATATNASTAVAATYFPNATISSITSGNTFVINTPAYANTIAAPVSATATTVNHGYQLFHYDFTGPELGTQTKIRFQATGYGPTAPTRSPRISIDDIVVATTAPPPTESLTMFDDGLHGDGAANDGVWGAAIPPQTGGTTINYRVVATDSNNATSSSPGSGNHTYTVNTLLTDATIKGAEFLGMPTGSSITLNVVATSDQYAYVEYGTSPGSYPSSTPVTLYSIDPAKPEFYNPIEITLAGLQPDTRYYYRLRHRDTSETTFKVRGERSFRTARPRGNSFVFTITADPHLDVNSDANLFARTMSNIRADAPDLHVDLGDIFMTDKLADGINGVPPEFGGGVFPNQARLNDRALMLRALFEQSCHSIPFFHTLGNHEAEYGYLFNAAADKQNNIPAWNLKARKAYYPTPVPDSFYTGNATPKDYPGGTLGLLEDYYSWEWGDALFIVLDPFWNVTTNPNSADDAWEWTLGKPQYDWFKATLQNSTAKYKFVFTHHLVGGSTTLADGTTPNFAARGGIEEATKYEWGGKNADGVTDGFATNRPGWGVPIHQLLVQHKVNAVFHGHDHFYAYQTLDGVVYLECPQPGTANFTTLGSSGDGKYTNGVLLPNSGHIRVSVSPIGAVAEYVRAYRPSDENTSRHNGDISHQFTMQPLLSVNADLAGLSVDSGTLAPAFAPGTTEYALAVPYATSSIRVTPVKADPNATITVNGTPVSSGSPSDPVNLSVGTNTITTVVTAEDGSTLKTYSVVVTRDKASQTITFTSPGDQLANATVNLSATGGASGNPVTFSVTGPAQLSSNTLTFTGAGSVTVTANQAGNTNYLAATPVPWTFSVTKAHATVTLSNLAHTYDGTAKSAAATTDPAGKAVSFTYDGNTDLPIGPGSYEVVATIDDPIYQGSATGTLVISKAAQTISFAPIADQMATATVILEATGGGSGNAVTFAVTDGPGSIAGGNSLTFTAAGSVTITASQAGNANFEAAAPVARTFTVTEANATVTLSELHQVADCTARAVTVTTVPPDLDVDVTYAGNTDAPTSVGTYAIVATITDPLYAGAANGTLVVDDPATMTLVEGGQLPAISDLGALDLPTHEMARYEVTFSLWNLVRSWAVANGYDLDAIGQGSAGDHPVRSINWHDAVKWCNARTEWENAILGRSLAPAYRNGTSVYRSGEPDPATILVDETTSGYRLPTAREWEFADRGGLSGTGKTYAGGNDPDLVAWHSGNSSGAIVALSGDRGTWPSGRKNANELGLYDFSGNIAEWTQDSNPANLSTRYLLGGSWNGSAGESAIGVLFAETPSGRLNTNGLRVARSVASAMAGALDNPLTWNSGGDSPWFAQTGTTHDAVDAAESGSLGQDQTSWVETTVTGPGNLSFRWKSASVADADFVRFSIGASEAASLSGASDWQENTFEIPEGDSVLRWQFARTSPVGAGMSRVWLDQVVYTPATEPELTTAPATDVTETGATLGGEVLHEHGRTVTARGVVYGTTSAPTLADSVVSAASGGIGVFSVPASGLAPGTTYHARAYATNAIGTGYGPEVFFTTGTSVTFTDGIATFSRNMLPGGRQVFHFVLAAPRIVALATAGGAALRAELYDGEGNLITSFAGDADVDLEALLLGGNYSLHLFRGDDGGSVQPFDLTIDASVVAAPRPDVTVGTTAAASVGSGLYSPASQTALLTSRRLRMVTGYATLSNRGNLPDLIAGSANGGNTYFAVTYFGPGGNMTASLLTGTYRTPELQQRDSPVSIRATITPNKRRLTRKVGKRTVIVRKTHTLLIHAKSTFDPSTSDSASIRIQTR